MTSKQVGAAPTNPTDSATKGYVDTAIAGVGGGRSTPNVYVATTDPASGGSPLAHSGSGPYLWFVYDGVGSITDIQYGVA